MIIVAIWLHVGLKRGIRAPNFTVFFCGACFHTFLAGIITPLHTLYMHSRYGCLPGTIQYMHMLSTVFDRSTARVCDVQNRPLIMLSASSLYIHYIVR